MTATAQTSRWTSDGLRVIRRALRRPARVFRRDVLPRMFWCTHPPDVRSARAVRVVGLLSSASGVGKSARLCMEMAARGGYTVSGANVAGLFDSDDRIPFEADGGAVTDRHGFSIYHLNPPMMLPGVVASGLLPYYRSYNVGYWAWELESLPREWVEALRFVHAVIVPSRFCQDAVRRYTDKPVLVVPHPVAPAAPRDRPAGDGSGRPFRVVSIFNFGSSFARKNPLALVRAFRAAFDDESGAELVLKTSQGDRYGADKARLLSEIGDRPNIRLVDELWGHGQVDDLIRSADVYASLHRSEGFGLPLAEAMMTETPVVATNWSGSTDFCNPETAFVVDCDLVDFSDSHSDYEQVSGARWAEPSVAHAAVQLRRVRDDPVAARNMAAAAKRALQVHIEAFSYERALAALRTGPAAPGRTGGGPS